MTTPIAQYPDDDSQANNAVTGHDLDPTNGQGDLVITVAVARLQALLIAANSTDDNNWSASVRWVDSDDALFQSESATDIALSSVDNDNSRLTRKGPRAEVTFTSEVADGTQNQINAYVDGHR